MTPLDPPNVTPLGASSNISKLDVQLSCLALSTSSSSLLLGVDLWTWIFFGMPKKSKWHTKSSTRTKVTKDVTCFFSKMKGFWSSELNVFCLQPSDLFDAILVNQIMDIYLCLFQGWTLVFHGLWWIFHQFNFDHFGLTSGSSMAKIMICSLIVVGYSRCDQEITLQSLLSPKYAEGLSPKWFSGYVRGWIVLKKNCVSEFVHFCFGEFCLSVIFLYAYLPKQPTNIGHIFYCQVHFRWYQQKKPCTIITAGHVFIYIIYIYFFITISVILEICFPPFPSLPWVPGNPTGGHHYLKDMMITFNVATSSKGRHQQSLWGMADGYRWVMKLRKKQLRLFWES